MSIDIHLIIEAITVVILLLSSYCCIIATGQAEQGHTIAILSDVVLQGTLAHDYITAYNIS